MCRSGSEYLIDSTGKNISDKMALANLLVNHYFSIPANLSSQIPSAPPPNPSIFLIKEIEDSMVLHLANETEILKHIRTLNSEL